MNNYNFENSGNEQNNNNQQDYFQPRQYPQQAEYVQYTNGQFTTPGYDEAAAKKKRKKEIDAIVIVSLLIAVVIAVFFVVKSASKGDSVFEVDVSSVIDEQLSVSENILPSTTQAPAPTTTVPTTPATLAPTEVVTTTAAETTAAATVPSSSDTTAPVHSEPTTAQTTAQTTTAATTQALSSQPSDAEILKVVSDSVNSLKDPAASFKGTKVQKIYIQLTECSVPLLVEPINKVLEFFAGEKSLDYDFTAGKATDPETGEEISSARAIPPTEKPFTLTAEGVAKYEFSQSGDKKTYKITLVPESSNLASPRPPHHNAACDTLDFSAFELPMGEVTKADFEYPGAQISVTLDGEGKVVEYHEHLDMKGSGEGTIGLTANGSMEGYIDEKWSIEWK